MNLKLEILTEDHAKQICCWKYEEIYSIYNFPDWNINADVIFKSFDI